MFTGLVETIGVVTEVRRHAQNLELVIRPDRDDLTSAVGASVAVDGACLTVTASRKG
jgi:riboflavin synthase alpha subunit